MNRTAVGFRCPPVLFYRCSISYCCRQASCRRPPLPPQSSSCMLCRSRTDPNVRFPLRRFRRTGTMSWRKCRRPPLWWRRNRPGRNTRIRNKACTFPISNFRNGRIPQCLQTRRSRQGRRWATCPSSCRHGIPQAPC